MNIKELQANIGERVRTLKEMSVQLGKEFSGSDNKIAFIKTAFRREILEKKERIPGAVITAWFLILLIFCYDWTYGMNWAIVFNFGALPLIVYYIVRSIKEAPSN